MRPPRPIRASSAITPPPRPAARRWRWPAVAAALTLALASSACSTLDERQRAWIFQPSDRVWAAGAAAAEGMEDVWIDHRSALTGEAVRLHALWAPAPGAAAATAPVLLYLHGARFDVRSSAQRIRRMQALGFSVLAVDYRGFGRSSTALPSEAMAGEDAEAAWDWLAAQHPQARRFVFGHSLGAAIAVHLASRRDNLHGLMLEGSFPSMAEVVRSMPWGWLPVDALLTQRFEAAEKIGRVKAPVLVVHGSDDRLIPEPLGRALYERAPEPKRYVRVEGGSHHDTHARGMAQYRAAIQDLFALPRCLDAPTLESSQSDAGPQMGDDVARRRRSSSNCAS